MTQLKINWSVSKEDAALIDKIVDRAESLTVGPIDRLSVDMDITACHANGNPLDLQRLLDADNFTFVHDVGGISAHIDRETGRLGDFFVPRCSIPMRTEED